MTRRSTRRGAAASAGGGSGDITAVVAGSGLTGGASTGSATLAVDHATATPAAVGTAAVGTATKSAREDHVHAHGNQSSDGNMHAAATTSVAGFLSAADKTTLDAVATTYVPLAGGTLTGALLVSSSGAVGTPSVAIAGDPDTGLYPIASNQLGVAAGGALALSVASSSVTAYAPDSAAAATTTPLTVQHQTSATATAGIAVAMNYDVENGSGTVRTAASIAGMLRTVTDTAENGLLLFKGMTAGALVNFAHIASSTVYGASGIGVGTLSATGVTTTLMSIAIASSMVTYSSGAAGQGGHAFTGTVNTSGARSFFTITPSANTGQTAGTAIKGFQYATYTKQWASNTAVANQSEFVVEAPTYAFASASGTMTGVTATLDVTGAPIAGTNLSSFANACALRVRDRAYHDKDLELVEMTAPSAPVTNNVRIYAEDNGSGKTRLMALFATGAAQQIAIEP